MELFDELFDSSEIMASVMVFILVVQYMVI